MVNKKIIGGLAALLVTAGALSLKRTPIELEGVGFGGYSYGDKPNVGLAFYNDGEERFPLIKKDNNFDYVNAYDGKGPRIQGRYNVKGHKNFLGSYATSVEKSE